MDSLQMIKKRSMKMNLRNQWLLLKKKWINSIKTTQPCWKKRKKLKKDIVKNRNNKVNKFRMEREIKKWAIKKWKRLKIKPLNKFCINYVNFS